MNNRTKYIASKLGCVLLGGVSMFALGLTAPAVAQEVQSVETIVVTGQRAAIESAIKIKENAGQIVDSIVADDAGKLPDRSITEVLQRVSGVTITHFSDLSNPDKYTVEGSGPAVRGLPGGTSTLNGHHAFSANNGRQILWGDVPSELMAAVDVYKTYTPDQIEGGLGGTINLRTHLPFDFGGTKVAGSVSASYGDLVKQLRPRGSLMGSTRWDTAWGEMGLLVDLSYDDTSFRNDSIQVEAYYPHTNVLDNYTLQGSPSGPVPVLNANPTTYWLPGGIDYHTTYGYHKRGGIYVAFQWRPSDTLSIRATAFSSVGDSNDYDYDFRASAGGHNANITGALNTRDTTRNTNGAAQLVAALSAGTQGPSDPYYHLFDAGNNLVYANSYIDTSFVQDSNHAWVPGQAAILQRCNGGSTMCSIASVFTQASKAFSRTTDLALGADWTPNEDWKINADFDFIYSKANNGSLSVGGKAILPSFGFDLRGAYPRLVANPTAFKTSADYFWDDTMDNWTKNYGQEMQGKIDAEYAVNYGMLKTVKFGVRGSARTEMDHEAPFNFQALTPVYVSPQHWWSETAAKSDIVMFQFPNYFRGEVNLPGPALFPDISKVGMYDVAYFQDKYGTPGTQNGVFDDHHIQHAKTVNVAAYAMVTFARDSVFGMAMDGNFGARLVYVDNQAWGYRNLGSTQFHFPEDATQYPGWTFPAAELEHLDPARVNDNPNTEWTTDSSSGTYVSGGRVSWVLLPAFNVQFMPTDRFHIRFAGSITAEQPDFAKVNGTSTIGLTDTTHIANSFNYQGDIPDLKPQIGRNLDVSFEWYGNGSDAHLSLFYKSIKHKVVQGHELQNMLWVYGSRVPSPDNPYAFQTDANGHPVLDNVQHAYQPTNVDTPINTDKETIVRGVEAGFTKYFDFDFVPSPLKGFGLSSNFTYIDSRSPGDSAYDAYGNNIGGVLPLVGLSHYAYNVTLMYDRDPVSFRLAYSWRSKYLMSAYGWNTHDTYFGADNGISCPQNNNAAGGWGGNTAEGSCTFWLPVWSKSFGSLDAGLDYALDENFTLSVQSQNLLNTKVKTTMGYGSQEHGRSWFVADRRVSMDLRMNF